MNHERLWRTAIHRQAAEAEELKARHAGELLALLDEEPDTAARETRIKHWRRVAVVADARAVRAREMQREAMVDDAD
jgi:hypothetical protein